MARKPGSKQLILEYFLQNVGKALESKDIQKASGGAVEWREEFASYEMRMAIRYLLTKIAQI